MDSERAELLASSVLALRRSGVGSVVLLDGEISKWEDITTWSDFISQHKGDISGVLRSSIPLGPEDDATIFFTSGTYVPFHYIYLPCIRRQLHSSGLPKGVLSTHRQFLSGLPNVSAPSMLERIPS